MKETLERERKLGAPEGFALPELAGDPIDLTLTSTYVDTADRRLARRGITLRHRRGDGPGAWQLKLPSGEHRRELELAGEPEHVPDRLRELLRAHVRGDALLPLATLITHRRGVAVRRGGDAVADVVLDTVEVLREGAAAGGFRELEIELHPDAGAGELRRLEKAMRRAGATDGEDRPKVFQALGMDRADTAPAVTGTPAADLAHLFRGQLEAMLAHDPGVRLGDDPEDLHKFRVAVRRLRAVLRAARDMLDERWVAEVRAELEWLADALGPARDADVLLARLGRERGTLGEPDDAELDRALYLLEDRRVEARVRMLAVLDDARYLALLDRLERDSAALPIAGEPAPLELLAGREVARLRKAVRKAGTDPSDEALHGIRIRGKRARYAGELAAISGGKGAARFVAEAKRFQDVLGEHQDATVADERLREIAAELGSAQAGIALGRLIERQHGGRSETRAGYARAWKRLRARVPASWKGE